MAAAAASAWPPGVASSAEMMRWPELVVRAILEKGDDLDHERQVRFLANFDNGFLSSSDYTGLWGDRESLTQVCAAGWLMYGWNLHHKLKFTRCCDIQKSVRHFLCESNGHWPHNSLEGGLPSCSPCVLGDILARLPPHALSWVKAALPGDKASPEVARRAYEDIHAYLDENRSWIFFGMARSPCDVQGQCCLVQPLMREFNALRDDGLERDNKRRRIDRPTVVNNSGTTCTEWTPAERGKKYADPSEVPRAVYITERKASAEKGIENAFFQENSHLYHYMEKLVKPLKDTHKVLRIVWPPEVGGFPLRHERSYTCGVNEITHVWLGPEDPDDVQQHFEHFFRRALFSDFTIFMIATPEMVAEEERRLLEPRVVCC